MWTRSFATLALLLALPLGGCGSHHAAPASPALPHVQHPAGDASLDRAFWRRAGRACHPYRVYEDAHPSVPDMDPEHPTRAQLGALAAFDRRTHSPFAVQGTWIRLVETIGTPRTGVADWRRIAADLRTYDAAGAAEQRAIAARDPRAWHVAYDRTVTALADLSTDLYAAGVPSTNDCLRLFG